MSNSFGYIYKTTNKISGMVYIGQSRMPFKFNYFGSGLYLKRAICKYGLTSFKVEILALAQNKEELNCLERLYIAQYRKQLGGGIYNISTGGQGGDTGCALKGQKHPNWGKTFSEELRKKLRKPHKSPNRVYSLLFGDKNPFYGKKHSGETKQKISLSRKGKGVGSNNAMSNPIFRKKAIIANRKVSRNPDRCKKISEAKKLYWANKRSKEWVAN